MKTFDAFCPGSMACQQAMSCDECEFVWYKQRCEELEKQIKELKNCQNCTGSYCSGIGFNSWRCIWNNFSKWEARDDVRKS
jgi:hypothetical protein